MQRTARAVDSLGEVRLMTQTHFGSRGRIPRALATTLAAAFAWVAGSAGAVTTALLIESNHVGARHGWSVAPAGDVNGDGFLDVVVGAPAWSGTQQAEGAALLYPGTATGLSPTPIWTVTGGQAHAHFGVSVAPAGDVNNDGYFDVIVGAPDHDVTGRDEGRAYLFLGSASGLATTPAWTADGEQDDAHFGHSVGSSASALIAAIASSNIAGGYQGVLTKSFNGDSYSDLVVGAPGHDGGQVDEGKVYVYHGSASGPSSTADWTAESDQPGAGFGRVVNAAGPTSGGVDHDLLVGAMYWDGNGLAGQGRAYLFAGGSGGLSPAPAWTRDGDAAQAFFAGSVAPAGDVNFDGYWDVLVGAWGTVDPSGTQAQGHTFLFLGSPAGPSTVPAWVNAGSQVDSQAGYSVMAAGLFNADPFFDVVLGAPLHGGAADNTGRLEVYLGSATGLQPTPILVGESTVEDALAGYAVSTAGDLSGDGAWEVLTGAPAYSNGELDEGALLVFNGVP